MNDLEQKINELLKEIQEIKQSQKEMNDKMSKMQQIIDHIEDDIYSEDGFDFEIVCPYCEHEFIVDASEDNTEVECPECKNTIELDWTGDLNEEKGCSGNCSGCSACEEDDM